MSLIYRIIGFVKGIHVADHFDSNSALNKETMDYPSQLLLTAAIRRALLFFP